MARGMVVGETIVSRAQNNAFDEGYERASLGKSEGAKERGRFIWDERLGKLVRAEDFVPAAEAKNAPIIADRIHEGTHFDGVDIGSRRKRREFLRATGWVDATDASPVWREGQAKERQREDRRNLRGAMENAARKLYHEGKFR